MTPAGGGHTAPAGPCVSTIRPMAGLLAILCALVVTALAAPQFAAAHEVCGGGGGGADPGVYTASIPPPPWDLDCDRVSSGSEDPDGPGPGVAGPDNCPEVRNADQTNTDGDADGDACDGDDDNDGVADEGDNCRTVVNPDQADSDGNGRGDACPPTDEDGDGTFEDVDNCRGLPNPDQANADGDRQGDACDFDDDDDYLSDGTDNCPLASNQDQRDTDNDGRGDACDPTPGTTTGPGPPNANDHRKPRVRVSLAKTQLLSDVLGGMPTSVRCSEACAISGRLLRGRRVMAKGTATLAARGRTWLFLRLRKGMARRIEHSGGRFGATLRLKVTDAAGNVTRARRRVTVAAG